MRVGNLCDAGVNDSGRPSWAKVVCDPGAMIKTCSSRKGGMLECGWAEVLRWLAVVLERLGLLGSFHCLSCGRWSDGAVPCSTRISKLNVPSTRTDFCSLTCEASDVTWPIPTTLQEMSEWKLRDNFTLLKFINISGASLRKLSQVGGRPFPFFARLLCYFPCQILTRVETRLLYKTKLVIQVCIVISLSTTTQPESFLQIIMLRRTDVT